MKIQIFDKSPTFITNCPKHYFVFCEMWKLTYRFQYENFSNYVVMLLQQKSELKDALSSYC